MLIGLSVKFHDTCNIYMNTVLRDRSQKSEIGLDSIINYFIFTKI